MAFPALALAIPWLSNLWKGSKWIILVGVLAFSHFYAYSKGHTAALESQLENVPVAVAKAERRGVEAVARASEAVSKLSTEERAGDEKVKALENTPNRTKCAASPDELRILEEIVESTK